MAVVVMEFPFSCSTGYLPSELCSFVKYQVDHSKRNFIFTYTHVLFLI